MSNVAHLAATVPLAIGAGAAFAVANVSQMLAARRVEAPQKLSPRLLLHLVRDPLWLLGLLASAAGYGLQAVALFLAPVVLVQPLIVSELLFALPLGARSTGWRLHRREWVGVVLVAGSLILFVLASHPSGGAVTVSADDWLLPGVVGAAALAALVVIGESLVQRPVLRATMNAMAASICFGFLSILTRVVGHAFANRGIGALATPEPYALAVTSIGGLLLAQNAFRIAPLSTSLPIIDVGEPGVAALLGVLLLGENFRVDSGDLAVIALSAAMLLTGVIVLDRSPLSRRVQAEITSKQTDTRVHASPAAD